ncbi:MAG: exosortase/archaeosortase family protein, partial [Longimicrobiales bacterium]
GEATAGAGALTRSGIAVDWPRTVPWLAAGILFIVLFRAPIANTASVWWSDPDAGHGLLLGPLAAFLAWKRGLAANARPQQLLGTVMLVGAVALRYLAGLATELFTMRLSAFGALLGIVVFLWGVRQLVYWWLPITLLLLSIPLPEIVLGTLALPLQFKASQMGATLLEWRHVPVRLAGNVIALPGGHQLFVTEACSGLRSLSSLLALGVLIGGLWLRTLPGRALLVLAAIPIAIALNGVRVFLTGFFVYFVDPALGEGLMHSTEGWVMFIAALGILAGVAWLFSQGEQLVARTRTA